MGPSSLTFPRISRISRSASGCEYSTRSISPGSSRFTSQSARIRSLRRSIFACRASRRRTISFRSFILSIMSSRRRFTSLRHSSRSPATSSYFSRAKSRLFSSSRRAESFVCTWPAMVSTSTLSFSMLALFDSIPSRYDRIVFPRNSIWSAIYFRRFVFCVSFALLSSALRSNSRTSSSFSDAMR